MSVMGHDGREWGWGSWPGVCGLILVVVAAIGMALWLSMSRRNSVECGRPSQALDERFAHAGPSEADYRRDRDLLDEQR